MSLLPDTDRILLGPGPSLTAPRVMRAMASPTVSHLDPIMLALLDDVRARLARVFRAPEGSFAFAVSGTGTSGMETAVANLVERRHARARHRHRLLRRSARADVRALRRDGRRGSTWSGDAPAIQTRCARPSQKTPADIVAMVHAETSTGVLQPGRPLAPIAREHGALVIVDAVTSLGGHPLDVGGLGHRRLLQLHAEVPRRAAGSGAGRLRTARARTAREVPQLLLRSAAARGLLAAPEVSPHDVVRARLRARRGARDRRGGGARGALGAARAEPHGAPRVARIARSRRAAARRRTAVDAERGARARGRRRGRGAQRICSTSSTSRSAPASARSPAGSGASG